MPKYIISLPRRVELDGVLYLYALETAFLSFIDVNFRVQTALLSESEIKDKQTAILTTNKLCCVPKEGPEGMRAEWQSVAI